MTAALLAARNVRAFGGWPVPVVGKVPYQDGWPELRLDPDKSPEFFNGRATGAGVNLGASDFALFYRSPTSSTGVWYVNTTEPAGLETGTPSAFIASA